MERQKFEQSCAIKFCVKLGESTTVTYEKLQGAYGEHSLSRAQVFRWHKSFLEENQSHYFSATPCKRCSVTVVS